MDDIYADAIIQQRMADAKTSREELMELVAKRTTIVNRLAICRLEDTGHRSNGYLITAFSGEDADACCIIHGYSDGEIGNKSRPPLWLVSMQIHSCQRAKSIRLIETCDRI